MKNCEYFYGVLILFLTALAFMLVRIDFKNRKQAARKAMKEKVIECSTEKNQ